MSSRSALTAILAALLLSMLILAPVAAAKPASPPGAGTPSGPPPSPEEEAAVAAAKLAAAQATLRALDAAGGDLVGLDCVTPTGDTGSSPDGATVDGCYVPQGFLTVYARDQIFRHYCGPAVGQVISNYAWAVQSTANRYTQQKLAAWMSTDLNGGTDAHSMERGLESSTIGAPRRPANWDWVVAGFWDFDGDGQVGDGLHDMVRANVSGSKMPLAIAVKPHDPNSQYHLSSWPRAVSSPGHWIAVYGWYGAWTGSDSARTYYTDSSKDEGGSTGKFWDPTRHIAMLILEHTRRLVW